MKRIILSLPAIIISIIIFILSSIEHIELPNIGFEVSDKVLHFIEYFFFGITLISLFVANFPQKRTKYIIWVVFLTGSLFALSDEIHQYFVPGRNCDFWDWVADSIGIIVALMLLKIIRKPLIRKIVKWK